MTAVLHVFNHPSEPGPGVDKALERVRAVGERLPLDALEITSHGFSTREYDLPGLPWVRVATDDGHTADACGRAWIELSCRRDRDAILRAIKAGDFWNCFAASQGRAP